MAPATEIATLPLIAGATIEEPDSSAGKVWQSTLDTVSAQDGFQRAYYGREVENQSVVQLLIDWDSVEHHKKFIADPVYGPFSKHLMSIVDGSLTMYHANLNPHPPSAAISSTHSPVTECLTCYFSSPDSSFEDNFNKFVAATSEDAAGIRAAAGGWLVEDIEHEKIGPGKKGKAFAAFLGWDSVEAHKKFRETDTFKDNIHFLREGPVVLEVHHTVFVEK